MLSCTALLQLFPTRVIAWLLPATLALVAGPLQARTVTLDASHCDLMATISAQGPRFGWMGYQVQPDRFDTSRYATASDTSAILIRFNLDSIPADQRIVRAELVLPVGGVGQHHAHLYIWKLLQPWGIGASHLNRMTRPERIAWNKPGARGSGTDRALVPTADLLLTIETGEISFNVTSDVDVWHADGSKNFGWMICTEAREAVHLTFPLQSTAWKLRITYERQ